MPSNRSWDGAGEEVAVIRKLWPTVSEAASGQVAVSGVPSLRIIQQAS